MEPSFVDDFATVYHGDCLDVMQTMEPDSVDAIVTDPPYGLSFMGRNWDRGVPGEHFWREALRVAKPGAHLVAFGGTKTHHRLMVAIEDAGWEIRDCLGWLYGSGFPKSLDVSKAIDKEMGAEREVLGVSPNWRESKRNNGQSMNAMNGKMCGKITAPATEAAAKWSGWGTALKPAWEPIVLARKPLTGTVAGNVQQWGTGALNIDGCRVSTDGESFSVPQSDPSARSGVVGTDMGITRSSIADFRQAQRASIERTKTLGRWPANIVHDGSDEVLAVFPQAAKGATSNSHRSSDGQNCYGKFAPTETLPGYGDSGSAARFFYTAKASKSERDDGLFDDRNTHPTVKPLALMRWLVRLVTPPEGIVFDPFMGSGTTLVAARAEGHRSIGVDLESEYCDIAIARIRHSAKSE